MALVQLSDFLDVIPAVLQSPHRAMHCTYDELADVIYVNFEPGVEGTCRECVRAYINLSLGCLTSMTP